MGYSSKNVDTTACEPPTTAHDGKPSLSLLAQLATAASHFYWPSRSDTRATAQRADLRSELLLIDPPHPALVPQEKGKAFFDPYVVTRQLGKHEMRAHLAEWKREMTEGLQPGRRRRVPQPDVADASAERPPTLGQRFAAMLHSNWRAR